MDSMDKLFTEWKGEISKQSGHFVEDGIISPEHWNASKRKVLFVLKETNGHVKSISETILKASTSKTSKLWVRPTFNNVGRWTHGLINTFDVLEPYENSNRHRRSAIRSCAFINIKKTAGKRTATHAVEQHAIDYAPFIRRQISIISPDIVVFGGTYKIMKIHVLADLIKVSHRVHRFGDVICINANHPACTKSRKDMYQQVVGNYRQYLASSPT